MVDRSWKNRDQATTMPRQTTMAMMETKGQNVPTTTQPATQSTPLHDEVATVDCPCLTRPGAAMVTGSGPPMATSACGKDVRELPDSEQKLDMMGVSVFSFEDCLLARTSYKGLGDDLLYQCTVSCKKRDPEDVAGGSVVDDWKWSSG